MTAEEKKKRIIDNLAREQTVERLIQNINRTESQFNMNDLANDIYLALLEKKSETIIELSEKKQLTFFIVRMIMNNIYSKNSPYYIRYKRFQMNNNGFFNIEDNI